MAEVGAYFKKCLQEINSPLITDVRGRGLILGIGLTIPAVDVVKAGYAQGLLMVNAGPDVLRFVPPLIFEPQHVDEAVEKLTKILSEHA